MTTLDNLRKAARRWLKAIQAGDAEAVARFQRAHPDAFKTPGLRDVQHALARERGYAGWSALKAAALAGPADQIAAALVRLLDAAASGHADDVAAGLDANPELLNRRALLAG